MNVYRMAALATAACLAGVTLTACSGGIATPGSSNSPAASNSPSSTPPSAPSSPATTPPAGSGSSSSPSSGSASSGTVPVGGSIGSFPLPPGAQVADNVTSGSQIDIVLGSVSASAADSFYTSALQSAGYTITSNASGTSAGAGVAAIEFTGHGYKGDIGALTSLGISFGGAGTVGITLTPQ
jgi:hypothetical protein